MTPTPHPHRRRHGSGRFVRAVASLVLLVPAIGGCTSLSQAESSAETQSGDSSPAASSNSTTTSQQDSVAAQAGTDASDIIQVTSAPGVTEGTLASTLVIDGRQGTGVSVAITSVTAMTATAQGPGEVSGPALRIEVSVDNTSGHALDLSNTAVTLTDSEGNPGSGMLASPANWLDGEVASDTSATGTYVFTLPEDARDPITVTVQVDTTMTTAEFSGDAS